MRRKNNFMYLTGTYNRSKTTKPDEILTLHKGTNPLKYTGRSGFYFFVIAVWSICKPSHKTYFTWFKFSLISFYPK